jgi:hypothetical protein
MNDVSIVQGTNILLKLCMEHFVKAQNKYVPFMIILK